MGLLFDAVTEKVEHGTGIEFSGNSTFLVWLRPTELVSSTQTVMAQDISGEALPTQLDISTGVGAGSARITVKRATTDLGFRAVNNSLVNNVWQCVAYTIDTGAGGNQAAIYVGDLTTSLVEMSYASTTNGSGAITV